MPIYDERFVLHIHKVNIKIKVTAFWYLQFIAYIGVKTSSFLGLHARVQKCLSCVFKVYKRVDTFSESWYRADFEFATILDKNGWDTCT